MLYIKTDHKLYIAIVFLWHTVPQGSVLGPLLFIVYINDIPLANNILDMLMYADDTTSYCNINRNIAAVVINGELLKITQWLGANKLALNVSKTKFMVFHTHNRSVSYPELQINGNTIERLTEFNFFGVWFYNQTYLGINISIIFR